MFCTFCNAHAAMTSQYYCYHYMQSYNSCIQFILIVGAYLPSKNQALCTYTNNKSKLLTLIDFYLCKSSYSYQKFNTIAILSTIPVNYLHGFSTPSCEEVAINC